MKIFYGLFSLCVLWFLTLSLHSTGPQPGVTGAPGETTCSTTPDCHFAGTETGTVVIGGLPDSVTANTIYTVTVTANSTNSVKGGFQITCLDNSNLAVGTLTAGTGQIAQTDAGRQYVNHNTPKIYANGKVSWSLTWKSPASAKNNPITFYTASLLANGNGGSSGDIAVTGTQKVIFKNTLSPTSDLTKDAQIIISPNPTSQILTVHFQQTNTIARLCLIDLSGKTFLQQTVTDNSNIRVGDLARGIYFARFIIGDFSVVKKIELN